jgi:hypothetical protein
LSAVSDPGRAVRVRKDSGSGGRRKAPARAARAPRSGVAVDEEQRRHLIECCAFFNAIRFRPARPGEYRRQDLLEAEARIDAILRKHKERQ